MADVIRLVIAETIGLVMADAIRLVMADAIRCHGGCHTISHGGCHTLSHAGCFTINHGGCHTLNHGGCHTVSHGGCHTLISVSFVTYARGDRKVRIKMFSFLKLLLHVFRDKNQSQYAAISMHLFHCNNACIIRTRALQLSL